MKIVKDPIEIVELKEMAQKMMGDFVKGVVDIEKEILAVEAEFHSDLMNLLIDKESSEPKNLWGINLYPDFPGDDFVVFDSMINLKPGLGNRTRGVGDPEIRKKIITIVNNFVKR